MCVVHLEQDGPGLVVSTCVNAAHARIETEEGSVPVDRAPERVGAAVLAALEACSWLDAFDLRGRSPRDWPAFRASGERSVRAFENGWAAVDVEGTDEENRAWTLQAALGDPQDLYLAATVAAAPTAPSELGELVLHLDERRRRISSALGY